MAQVDNHVYEFDHWAKHLENFAPWQCHLGNLAFVEAYLKGGLVDWWI